MGIATQGHVGLLRGAIALAHIATQARCGHVFPDVTTTAAAGQHVINRQLTATTAAVLTTVLIPLKQIASGLSQLAERNMHKLPQPNHRRHMEVVTQAMVGIML